MSALRVASLGSGSAGNATLVESGSTCVLVDCGFSIRETERRLGRLGRSAADLDAVLVTHEHGDHVRGVGPLARRHGLDVWMTHGTAREHGCGELPRLRHFSCHAPFAIGDLAIEPYPVPHDAREPSQFVFGNGAERVGLLTDVGHVTPHILEKLAGVRALLLECNHDPGMLRDGSYPPALKRRVGGHHGHLANAQAADILARLDRGRLDEVVAMHLSERNNQPELARAALGGVLGDTDGIRIAEQEAGFDWLTVA
ncbi:MAG: MBL fold metallo-hydrolase [Pseudomonadota bacterium]